VGRKQKHFHPLYDPETWPQKVIPERGNQYPRDPTFPTFKDLRNFANIRLAPPAPRQIEHVVLDADDTIWDVHPWGMISLCKPDGRSTGNTLSCSAGPDTPGQVTLDPTLRETLAKLKEKGIGISIASSNDKKSVVDTLDAFGLLDQFSQVEADYTSAKSTMVKRIAQKQNIPPERILFVDDGTFNVADVVRTGASGVLKYQDIEEIIDILEFIE